MKGIARSLWDYRFFIWTSIRNDFHARFVRSKLGGLWVILHPLSQVLIYALILSNLLAAKIPGIESSYGYAVYLMAGLLAWNLFTDIIDRCVKIFISNGNVIKKVNFPKITLPIIAVGSAVISNVILFIVMNVILVILGHPISPLSVLYFTFIPVVVALAVGIGLTLGVINVFIRDIEQVVPIVLQVLFWMTPIVYPITIIPERYQAIMSLSPVYVIVEAYHNVIVYQQWPDYTGLAMVLALGLVLCALALTLFRRASADMVDAL